jgi:hypothetical protein
MILQIISVLISIVLGYLRLTIKTKPSQSFQAIAHIWVGVLIGWLWTDGWLFALITVVLLTILEIVAFLIHKRDNV